MNEKVYKGIELTAATVASIGVDFVVTKAVSNLVKPELFRKRYLQQQVCLVLTWQQIMDWHV